MRLPENQRIFMPRATRKPGVIRSVALPLAVVAVMVAIWTIVWRSGIFHPSAFPAPLDVLRGFREEARSGRLFTDLITSLFRVTCGFGLAVLTGIPAGLWMGQNETARTAFLPIVNFFRNLSPLAWIPFAILWFGVGDASPILLIFLSRLCWRPWPLPPMFLPSIRELPRTSGCPTRKN